MSLGNLIRESRKAKGIKQSDVAEKLNVSVQAVSQWERDLTNPSAINLIELKDLLGFSLDTPISPRDMLSHLPTPLLGSGSRRQAVQAPLVDWKQSPEKWGAEDDWDTEDFLSIHWKPVGDIWALRFDGYDMEPVFKTGDIVIIDTGRAPEKGDYVVAKLDNSHRAELAIYFPTGLDKRRAPTFDLRYSREHAKPKAISSENPGYVIGVVREHRRFYRMS